MSHLADPSKKSEKGDRLLNKESFLSLLSNIRSDYSSDQITNNTRLTILQALLRLKLADKEILDITAKMIAQDKFTNLNQLTNALYVLGKFKYKSSDSNKFIEQAILRLKSEPKLEIRLACRNLWNLFALDYKSQDALKLFADVILRVGEPYKLNELDIANSLRAFAHF